MKQKEKDLKILEWVEKNQPIDSVVSDKRDKELRMLKTRGFLSGEFSLIPKRRFPNQWKVYEVCLNDEGDKYLSRLRREEMEGKPYVWLWRDYGKPILIGLVLLIIGFLLGKYYG